MKKFLLTILLFLIPTIGHCTTWYLCTTPAGGWSNTSSWTSVMGDQGTCVASLGAPAAGDTAILNSSSGSVALDSATADVAATVTMTGYTGTLTLTGADILIVSGGTVTLGGTITGTGTLKVTGAETLTSAGVTWPGALNLDYAGTVTLSNSGATWTNTGLVTVTLATVLNLTTTGDTLTMNGGLASTTSISGTASIILGGGTWSATSNNGVNDSLTIAGNVTISGGVGCSTGTITYSSGTITTSGSNISVTNCTLNTAGMTWNIIACNGGTTTLQSNLSATTLINNQNTGAILFAGAYNITIQNLETTWSAQSMSFSFVAGQTLNITNLIGFINQAYLSALSPFTLTIKSATASSPTYINYTGKVANENLYGVTFTDVIASAPAVPFYGPKLLNFNGGTLTRTQGIVNVNASNINPKVIRSYNGVV